MRPAFIIILGAVLVAGAWNCEKKTDPDDPTPIDTTPPPGATPIPATSQVSGGDAAAGWDYLRYGDFIGGGFPYDLFVALAGNRDPENLLGREGDNAVIGPAFNAFTAASGARVVGGATCFACHAAKIDGQFIPGLGNSFSDFTADNTALFNLVDQAVLLRHGRQSPEWEAYEPLSRSGKKAAPHAVMPFKGINPAFMLEQAGVAHHQPIDLAWTDAPVFPIPERRVGSDIPPLWNVKKKNALYYNAMGRGDFTKLLMQVSALAVSDTAHARRINERFPDVLAWLRALSPPVYPRPIDRPLAEKGEAIYTRHCQKCHGTKEEYPNLLVETKVVGTDPAYAEYFLDHPGFNDWYNQSWYATSSRPSSAQPSLGYVAPPLDGVWATAPYLHNGSVPTLEDLLDSRRRPAYWRRSFDDKDYDFQKVGWAYTRENGSVDQQTYNTTLSGYGNQGHTYGDVLSTEEREALIEYLKTW